MYAGLGGVYDGRRIARVCRLAVAESTLDFRVVIHGGILCWIGWGMWADFSPMGDFNILSRTHHAGRDPGRFGLLIAIHRVIERPHDRVIPREPRSGD